MAGASWFLNLFEWEQGGDFQPGFEQMDPALWSGLPEEVLFEVVAKLPLRFMAVSRRWKEVLISANVIEQRTCLASVSKQPAGPGDLRPLAKLGMPMVKAHSFHLSAPADDLEFGASHGGLLCFFSFDGEGLLKLFLCNPLTATWEELPAATVPVPEEQIPPGYVEQKPHVFMQEDGDIVVVKWKYVVVFNRELHFWQEPRVFPSMEEWWIGVNGTEKLGDPVMSDDIIYQLDNFYVLHLLDVNDQDNAGEVDMGRDVGPIWFVEHDGSVFCIDMYDDMLHCYLIDPEAADWYLVCSGKEQSRRFWAFLSEFSACDSKAVSLFGFILVCPYTTEHLDSGYLLALDVSEKTWSSFFTSRQQAVTIAGLFPFTPEWIPSDHVA